MDDSFLDALEDRIKDMSDLRRIMNSMKHSLSEVKINIEDLKDFEQNLDDALKFTLQIKELDVWTLQTLKKFKEISELGGFQVLKEKADSLITFDFVDLKKARKALLERGIKVLSEYEPQFQEILNSSVKMALDFLASKKKAIEKAQKLIKPYMKSEK